MPRTPDTSILARFPELRRLILKHYARHGNLQAAAAHCRVSVAMIQAYADRNADFKQQLENAHGEHCAKIEEAIYTRAIDGIDEPRFGQSGVLGYVKRYSDPLLLAYAKRHIPEYRQGDVTHKQVSGTVNHEISSKLNLEQLTTQQRAALRTLLGHETPAAETPKRIEVQIHPDEDDVE